MQPYYLTIVFSAAIIGIAQILFKKHLHNFEINIPSIKETLKKKGIILGAFLYFLGLFFYLVALKHVYLSIAYPVFSTSIAFVAIFSFIMLKEKLGKYRVVGIILIIAGIFLVYI
ncbi:MAG: EamA family transporter [Candidatus Micrarchaeaceae archaeon]